MDDKEHEEELNRIMEEEIKKMNLLVAEKRAQSVEAYGRDIYTDKTVGNKKVRKVNSKIEKVIIIIHILIRVAIGVGLILGLIVAWGGLINM